MSKNKTVRKAYTVGGSVVLGLPDIEAGEHYKVIKENGKWIVEKIE